MTSETLEFSPLNLVSSSEVSLVLYVNYKRVLAKVFCYGVLFEIGILNGLKDEIS